MRATKASKASSEVSNSATGLLGRVSSWVDLRAMDSSVSIKRCGVNVGFINQRVAGLLQPFGEAVRDCQTRNGMDFT